MLPNRFGGILNHLIQIKDKQFKQKKVNIQFLFISVPGYQICNEHIFIADQCWYKISKRRLCSLLMCRLNALVTLHFSSHSGESIFFHYIKIRYFFMYSNVQAFMVMLHKILSSSEDIVALVCIPVVLKYQITM